MPFDEITISACLLRHKECKPDCQYRVSATFHQLPDEPLVTFQKRASEEFKIRLREASRLYRLGWNAARAKYKPHPKELRTRIEILADIKAKDDQVKKEGHWQG